MPTVGDRQVPLAGAADNPGVPNMLNVGMEQWYGFMWLTSNVVRSLALPFRPDSLPIAFRDNNGRGYVRAPAELLLDVVVTETIWADRDLEWPPCEPMIHERFDRYQGYLQDIGENRSDKALYSEQRRVIRVGPSGRMVLLNSNTSAFDFVHALRTPGSIRS